MIRGRKPKPTALRRSEGNPGKRAYNHAEPEAPGDLPDCPEHLSAAARAEWDRLAGVMHEMGVLSTVDRAGFAAYCQCYGRWVEAELKLKDTPLLYKTQTGYIQQSPWLSVANKQLELMGRYMTEFGLTPASRARVAVALEAAAAPDHITRVELVVVSKDQEGNWVERPMQQPHAIPRPYDPTGPDPAQDVIFLNENI